MAWTAPTRNCNSPCHAAGEPIGEAFGVPKSGSRPKPEKQPIPFSERANPAGLLPCLPLMRPAVPFLQLQAASPDVNVPFKAAQSTPPLSSELDMRKHTHESQGASCMILTGAVCSA